MYYYVAEGGVADGKVRALHRKAEDGQEVLFIPPVGSADTSYVYYATEATRVAEGLSCFVCTEKP